jgi:hypothetical protein
MSRHTDPTVGSTVPDPEADESDSRTSPTFDQRNERFALGAEIGRGGMGRVIAATDVALGREVAIKKMLSQRPDDLTRFEREVRITAQLEHPSIVPIYEAARDGAGAAYYVMRRIEGEPLSKRLVGRDLRARLALLPNLLAVVDAAAFAHARDIIHRDIKPSNILLGSYGETHLIDWGLARRLDESDLGGMASGVDGEQLTRVGHVYGTVAYMAPEQARGEPVDQRADVYALGATLFHLCAGSPPFSNLSDAERIAAAETGDDVAPLDKLGAETPSELVAIVDKAMARDRDTRYRHAGELAADLRAFLAGKLVGAHRYTMSQRIARFLRRHRFAVAVALSAIVALVVVSVVAISNIVSAKERAEAAMHRAEERRERMLLDQASSLVNTDATRALAMLRQIPTTSNHAELARDLASTAASRGIWRGATAHERRVNSLAFSSDGRRLASAGEDGRLVLYDVATGKFTVRAELGKGLFEVHWNPAGTLVGVTGLFDGIRLYDADNREAPRVLAPKSAVARWWFVSPDRVRLLDGTTKTLLEVTLSGDERIELASSVESIAEQGSRVLFKTGSSLFLLDGNKSRALEGTLPDFAIGMAFSTNGERVAVLTQTLLSEWDTRSGARSGTWTIKAGLSVRYGVWGPIVSEAHGVITYVSQGGRAHSATHKAAPLWHAPIASGAVFLFESGSIMVADRAGSHMLPFDNPGSRAITTLPGTMLIAIGSRDGTVRWMNLAQVTPKPIAVPPATAVCGGTPSTLYLATPDRIDVIDVATGNSREILELEATGAVARCAEPIGSWLPVYTAAPVSPDITFVNLHDKQLKRFRGGHGLATTKNRARFAFGNEVKELDIDGNVRTHWTAPAKLVGLAWSGTSMLLQVDNGTLVRLDDATGSIETVRDPGIARFGIRQDGSPYLVRGKALYVWSDDGPRKLHEFDSNIVDARGVDDETALWLEDGSVWMFGPNGIPKQRARVGFRTNQIGARGLSIAYEGTRLTTFRLRSGEHAVRETIRMETAVVLADGKTIVLQASSSVLMFIDPVPETFAEALVWIDGATNAVFDPTTSALTWR